MTDADDSRDDAFEDPWEVPDPPEVKFDPTSVDELIEFAHALLENPAVGAALQRVGVHGDTTEAEDAEIEKAIDAHIAQKQWGVRDRALLYLALVLGRWVAGGAIPSVDGPEARAFLEDRYFTRPGDQHGIFGKKPTVEEVRWIARDLMKNPVVWNECVRAGVDRIDDRIWETVILPLTGDLRKKKYGLLNRGTHALAVVRSLARGELTSLDSPEAEALIRLHNRI
ncbi:hypothetical protein [Methylocystis parvus]|uniref:Uncharacterized protein n=1 Tax=Methylocystis parvus TaxID=134 RepID=A0A6B8M818_9HYPH|nr:hypothetical protein [Methylocystis parvus]QGM97483.1 hypothetical protein F7D14_08415 [Methylocystis parvus]WBJ98597.1 hypothetical protein MMG94_11185 [Methylocystis parvus OBBP]